MSVCCLAISAGRRQFGKDAVSSLHGQSEIATPPGTIHDECTRSCARPSTIMQSELSQFDAIARQFRMLCDDAQDVACRWIGVHAKQKIGRRKIEEAQRMGLHELAQCSSSRESCGRWGMRTAMIASHALDDASRWLTGQIPQMRAVIPGIS